MILMLFVIEIRYFDEQLLNSCSLREDLSIAAASIVRKRKETALF